MSRLEKFIRAHRDEFDDMSPTGQLWQQVEAGIASKNRKGLVMGPWTKWAAAAAAILVTIAAAFFLIIVKKNLTLPVVAGKDAVTTDVIALGPDEAPQVNQFAKLIAVKQQELKVLAKEQPSLYARFATDITQLDSSYNNLKRSLSVTPNREVLIEAMIQNLELQLNLLNQQLNIIKQVKQLKKNSHEKNLSFT